MIIVAVWVGRAIACDNAGTLYLFSIMDLVAVACGRVGSMLLPIGRIILYNLLYE